MLNLLDQDANDALVIERLVRVGVVLGALDEKGVVLLDLVREETYFRFFGLFVEIGLGLQAIHSEGVVEVLGVRLDAVIRCGGETGGRHCAAGTGVAVHVEHPIRGGIKEAGDIEVEFDAFARGLGRGIVDCGHGGNEYCLDIDDGHGHEVVVCERRRVSRIYELRNGGDLRPRGPDTCPIKNRILRIDDEAVVSHRHGEHRAAARRIQEGRDAPENSRGGRDCNRVPRI